MKTNKQFLIMLSFTIGLLLRLVFLPVHTSDMRDYNLKWYDYIANHGIVGAMGNEFANYSPPYLYLLSLATLTKSFLPKLTAIKLIPIVFDLINSILVYQIVKTHFNKGIEPVLAGMIFWVMPTVVVNGSLWGQADASYTCFLLVCALFLLRDRSIAAITAFAIAFSIKAQAIFILPFLAILVLRKQIPWQSFLLIPPVYFIMMLPAVLAGRSISSLALTYVTQGNTYAKASMNAPNFYFFLPQSAYQASLMVGIPLAGLILLAWVIIYGLKRYSITPALPVVTALVSLALSPFLLPKMHDRYFYPADIFSLIVAFFVPGTWFVPIAYQVISLISYMPYLLGASPWSVIPFAVLVNTLTIGFLLWKHWRMTSGDDVPSAEILDVR